nr:MAG TPA: hypothetical protein [Caudoviricetes sp.]
MSRQEHWGFLDSLICPQSIFFRFGFRRILVLYYY